MGPYPGHGFVHPSHVLRLSRWPGASAVVLLGPLSGERFRAPRSRFELDQFCCTLFGRTLRTAPLLVFQACFFGGALRLVTPAARSDAFCAPQNTLACFLVASLACFFARLLAYLLARAVEQSYYHFLACVASLPLLSLCACAHCLIFRHASFEALCAWPPVPRVRTRFAHRNIRLCASWLHSLLACVVRLLLCSLARLLHFSLT